MAEYEALYTYNLDPWHPLIPSGARRRDRRSSCSFSRSRRHRDGCIQRNRAVSMVFFLVGVSQRFSAVPSPAAPNELVRKGRYDTILRGVGDGEIVTLDIICYCPGLPLPAPNPLFPARAGAERIEQDLFLGLTFLLDSYAIDFNGLIPAAMEVSRPLSSMQPPKTRVGQLGKESEPDEVGLLSGPSHLKG